MKRLNRSCIPAKKRPIKVLQFGGGNFLRGFLGWMVQILNEETGFDGNIAVVKPTARGSYDALLKQEGLYQVLLQGIRDGRNISELKLVDSIGNIINPYQEWDDFLRLAEIKSLKLVVSNTTEAGIRFERDVGPTISPDNFPAKLTLWLNHRYQHFEGNHGAGCIFLPCELIAGNGDKLRACIIEYAAEWHLGDEFIAWIEKANIFCNTLVDRIVSGYPTALAGPISEKAGWEDSLLVAGELYHSWVIEGPGSLYDYFPTNKTSLNVTIVPDLAPFHELKVRVLNGTHTLMVPVGNLLGFRFVRECVEDELMGNFMVKLQDEICSTISLPPKVVMQYRKEVMARFGNPFIEHELMSIALNAMPKLRSRVLPTLLDYHKKNKKFPSAILLAFAALIYFYRAPAGGGIQARDADDIIDLFTALWARYDDTEEAAADLARAVLGRTELWGSDLNQVMGFSAALGNYLFEIAQYGIRYPMAND